MKGTPRDGASSQDAREARDARQSRDARDAVMPSAAVLRPSVALGPAPLRPAPDFIDVVVRTAARRPEHVAVDGPDARLTYAELDRLSNQLAHRLIALGVGPEQCVGISMPRGAAELLAMLAVSKAGGAYVPLDPSHPIDRLRLILEDAAPAAMIVHPTSPVAAETAAARNVIVLDDLQRGTAGQDVTLPRVAREP